MPAHHRGRPEACLRRYALDCEIGRLEQPLRTTDASLTAWLIHACWDLAHYLWGNPIWPFMPSSAFGCMIFDTVIASWFLAGAPSVLRRPLAAAAEQRSVA